MLTPGKRAAKRDFPRPNMQSYKAEYNEPRFRGLRLTRCLTRWAYFRDEVDNLPGREGPGNEVPRRETEFEWLARLTRRMFLIFPNSKGSLSQSKLTLLKRPF
jgi:hypothetical protein